MVFIIFGAVCSFRGQAAEEGIGRRAAYLLKTSRERLGRRGISTSWSPKIVTENSTQLAVSLFKAVINLIASKIKWFL